MRKERAWPSLSPRHVCPETWPRLSPPHPGPAAGPSDLGPEGGHTENSGVTQAPQAPAWPLALPQGHRRLPIARPSEEGPVNHACSPPGASGDGAAGPAPTLQTPACPWLLQALPSAHRGCRGAGLSPQHTLCQSSPGGLPSGHSHSTLPSSWEPSHLHPQGGSSAPAPLQSRSRASTSWSRCLLVSDPPPGAAQGRARRRSGARASANTSWESGSASAQFPLRGAPAGPRQDSPLPLEGPRLRTRLQMSEWPSPQPSQQPPPPVPPRPQATHVWSLFAATSPLSRAAGRGLCTEGATSYLGMRAGPGAWPAGGPGRGWLARPQSLGKPRGGDQPQASWEGPGAQDAAQRSGHLGGQNRDWMWKQTGASCPTHSPPVILPRSSVPHLNKQGDGVSSHSLCRGPECPRTQTSHTFLSLFRLCNPRP